MMVENVPEILTKRRSQKFYKLIDVFFVTNVVGEIISSITMWSIVSQLDKLDFSWELAVNKL